MRLIPFSPCAFYLTYLCINPPPSGDSGCLEAGLPDSCLYSQQHPARDLTHSRYSVMFEIIVKPEQHEPAYLGTGSGFANTYCALWFCSSTFVLELLPVSSAHPLSFLAQELLKPLLPWSYRLHFSPQLLYLSFLGFVFSFFILTVKVEKYPHVFHINLYLCDTICYNFLL